MKCFWINEVFLYSMKYSITNSIKTITMAFASSLMDSKSPFVMSVTRWVIAQIPSVIVLARKKINAIITNINVASLLPHIHQDFFLSLYFFWNNFLDRILNLFSLPFIFQDAANQIYAKNTKTNYICPVCAMPKTRQEKSEKDAKTPPVDIYTATYHWVVYIIHKPCSERNMISFPIFLNR